MKKSFLTIATLGSSFFASGAFAQVEVATKINEAVTAGETNVGLVVLGVIGLAALMFGLGYIVKGMLRT